MIVGGISAGGSVGAAGGWLLGGGHSALSPTYGLSVYVMHEQRGQGTDSAIGVDNLLEVSLVTANGAHNTVNAHRHTDLFGALRGGEGGTYGVVTSVTHRTCPIVPVKVAFMVATVNNTGPTTALTKALQSSCVSPLPSPMSDGEIMQGFLALRRGFLTFFALIPNVSWEQANETIVPYLDRVRELAHESSALDEQSKPAMTVTTRTASFPSFYSV